MSWYVKRLDVTFARGLKMTAVYTYTMPWGERLHIRADLSEASAPIQFESAGDERWISTPYQTADAGHHETTMLQLVIEYLGSEWYANPHSEASDAAQLEAAVEGATLLED